MTANKVGRPSLKDKKTNKTLKLSSTTHKQLKELSVKMELSQAVIIEKLVSKATKNNKLLN